MSSSKIIGENDNVVRIMSIHKSKGLEFPIIILSGTGKKFNIQDLNQNLLLHQELGLGPDYINSERRIAYPLLAKLALKQKIKLELLSEELRILYVALTRAKEKLIITGIEKDYEKRKQKYSLNTYKNIGTISAGNYIHNENRKIQVYKTQKASSFMNWFELLTFNVKDINNIIDIKVYSKQEILKLCSDVDVDTEESIYSNMSIQDKMDKMFEELLTNTGSAENLNNYYTKIDSQLSWEYKNQFLTTIPTKLSITELKRKDLSQDNQEVIIQEKPEFLKDKYKLTNTEIGTLMHLVIQHIDFNEKHTIQSIENAIKNMVLNNIISSQEAQIIRVNSIYKFFKSELYARIEKSNKVYKEQPFYMSVSLNQIYEKEKSNEKIIIQGIIDCYFEENGEYVLVDYKTDHIQDDNIDVLKNKYKVQLRYYKEAIQKATLKPVKEVYIYSLYRNKAFLIE